MANKEKASHRQRLRENFLAGEAGSRSDETLLELLLTFANARKDVRALAKELIRVFGSLSLVLSASSEKLYKVKGIDQSSVALLKAVNFIRSDEGFKETRSSIQEGSDAPNTKFFEELGSGRALGQPEPVFENTSPHDGEESSKGSSFIKKSVRHKFQVSNGYLLEFDQLARVLHVLLGHREAKKINRKVLKENTGLADRQLGSLVSMGSAMGLIKSGNQTLTPIGLLVAEHDIFISSRGSLEWCHYVGAGSYRNLIWFEIFNRLLLESTPMTQEEWNERIRRDLTGKYSKQTIKRNLYQEIRFVIDAYTKRNFSRLELLNLTPEDRLYKRRYTNFALLVLAAMIYDFCTKNNAHLFQVGEMAVTPGSPAVVFGLDDTSLRGQIEALHDRGWLRYETTHNLDQIRLRPGYTALEFLSAYFEDREPHQVSDQYSEGTY